MSKNNRIQLSKTKEAAGRYIKFKRLSGFAVMFTEGVTASFWALFSWICFFAGLWLMGVPDMLGDAGAVIIWLAFICGLLYLIRKSLQNKLVPDRNAIDRRIEQDSGLQHRPLQTIDDRLATEDSESGRRMWIRNKLQAFDVIRQLRFPKPRAVITRYDSYALRFAALLVLLLGLANAGPYAGERLALGLFPFSFGLDDDITQTASLSITPPEYTTRPVINIVPSDEDGKIIEIPQGSIIKAKVTNGMTGPKLAMNGEAPVALEELGPKSWALETLIKKPVPPSADGQAAADEEEEKAPHELQLKQWPRTLLDVPYYYIPDTPPVLTQHGETDINDKAEIRFPLIAKDDYGIVEMHMDMELDSIVEQALRGIPYEETRPVFSAPNADLKFEPDFDLAWHPWAGLPVIINIQVKDHIGQTASLETIQMTLPERIFTHPVAKDLIDIRQQLIWQDTEFLQDKADMIEEYTNFPDLLENDPVIALALQSAASRLRYAETETQIIEVIELLWDIAIRLEDGNLAQAAQNLQAAQENLQNLLADPNASDEEIAEAMFELRQALSQYMLEVMKEYQKELARQGRDTELPIEMFENMMQPQDLDSYLDKLLSEALTGDKQSAQQMLSELENFMDQLGNPENFDFSPQMKFQMKGISDLQKLIEQQEALLEQTREQHSKIYKEAIEQHFPEFVPFTRNSEDPDDDVPELDNWDMPPPEAKEPAQTETKDGNKVDTSQHKVEQDALRYALGQLMMEADQVLNEIPENMQLAEQEMRSSADALGENQPGRSIPHQEKAIEHLKQSMDEMSKQLQQGLQNMSLFSFGAQRLDPLGRPMDEDGEGGGDNPFSKVKVPDKQKRKKVQDILNTLRKKSGEFERPEYELDYYRRLMQQF